MSIGARVFLGIVVIQLVSAALILGWYFHSLQSELSEATRRSAQEAVLQSIQASEDYFLEAQEAAQTGRALLDGGVLGGDEPGQLERYFFEQLRLLPQLAGIYVGYPDGGFLYVMRSDQESLDGTRTKIIRNGTQGREVDLTWRDRDFAEVKTTRDPEDAYDPRARGWYKAAIEEQDSVWTQPYIFFTSRKPGITLAAPIKGEDGAVAAVFGLDIEISEISTFLARNSLSLGGSAFIATSEGAVIAHSNAELATPVGTAGNGDLRFRNVSELGGVGSAISGQLIARLAEQQGGNATTVWEEEAEGEDYFVAVGQMSDAKWPWQTVVIVPKTGQMEIGHTSNLLLIGVILLATALACIFGYLLSRSIGKPLATLHRNALLARNANIEIMDKLATGSKEIDETAAVLYDLAAQRRRGGPPD